MKKADVAWLSPETGEVACTLSGCRKKFKTKVVEQKPLTVVNGREVTYSVFYSVCNECGRKHAMSTDKEKTQVSKNEAQKSLIFLKEV
jgi:hypothetical protein